MSHILLKSETSAELDNLRAQLASKDEKLIRAEEEVIKLTKLCAELMSKDLNSGEPVIVVCRYVFFVYRQGYSVSIS